MDELVSLALKPLIELLEHDAVIIFVSCKGSRQLYPRDEINYVRLRGVFGGAQPS